MKCLIIRFVDYEGPGELYLILKTLGYQITIMNAYDKNVHLMNDSHFLFDLFVFMGGPYSVREENKELKPYLLLIEEIIQLQHKKIIGICLGSQLIAKALGSKVYKGEKGPEVGFGKLQIIDQKNPIFKGIDNENVYTFHLHEDTFDLPKNSKLLLSSVQYSNQMFSFENRIFGIQSHFEINSDLLDIWKIKQKEFIARSGGIDETNSLDHLKIVEQIGKILFNNLLSQNGNNI